MHELRDKSTLCAEEGDYETMLVKIAWMDVISRQHTMEFALEIMHMYELHAFHNSF